MLLSPRRKKPNRKTGYIHPGTKKNYIDKYLIAIDTSASIDKDLLAQFLTILNQLTEITPIDFMQFDCQKQTDPKPFDRKKLKLDFKGRGGTDFQIVMDTINKHHYKCAICFVQSIPIANLLILNFFLKFSKNF